MLYVVVPTYNRIDVFNKFIEQMEAQTNQEYRLVVVDHGKVKTEYKKDNAIIIESNVNGWSYAINIGIRYVLNSESVVDSDYILVINDDVIMERDYIDNVYKSIKARPSSLIGSGCYDCDTGKVLHVNMMLQKRKAVFYYYNLEKTRAELKADFYESDVLKGRGTVIPVFVLKNIGIYAEERLPHYRADHELVWRAKKNSYDVCVSSRMWLGAKLDSPNVFKAQRSLKQNYKALFFDMISTQNLKDLWNYSFSCFGKIYGFYFFVINCLRFHLLFIKNYIRKRND